MDKNINSEKKNLRSVNRDIKDYFVRCSDSIDNSNHFMLRRVCMYLSIFYLSMLIFANLLLPEFRMTTAHWLLFPFLFVYFIINLLTRNRTDITTLQTSVMCLLFYFILCMIVIQIDMSEFPTLPSLWTPLVLIIFPTLFIDRMYKYGIEELVIVCISTALSYHYRPYDIFLRDTYSLLAGYILSMLCANIILNVRSHEGLAINELTEISTVDTLTHTLNKGALLNAIDNYFSRRKPSDPCSICIIDVDNFKTVNDKLGHNSGDILLNQIGILLKKSFRNTDIIGRFGGDEFIVFMPGLSDKKIVEMRCRTLQMMLSDFNLGNSSAFSLSIGAIVDLGNHPYGKIFRMADDALYESKQVGKNCCSTWVVGHRDLTGKPLIVFGTTPDNENAAELISKIQGRYEIIQTDNGTDSLLLASQYHGHIKLAIIDMQLKEVTGEQTVRYIKTRSGFEHIPVLAIVSNEDDYINAKLAGADKILYADDYEEKYIDTINALTKSE